MIIEVTQEHIDKGRLRNSQKCPFALACLAKGLKEVQVCSSRVYFDGFTSSYPLPKPIRRFVHRFDLGLPVKPSRFRLEGIK